MYVLMKATIVQFSGPVVIIVGKIAVDLLSQYIAISQTLCILNVTYFYVAK